MFAAEHEPGAEALLGDGDDDAVLPAGGDSMLYGDGGAGKTTLALHLAMHLASGTTFLGITVQRPVNVLLLENEGPRPLYRRKIERKLADWLGHSTTGRLHVWQAPWGRAGFGTLEQRQQLADAVADNEIDVLIAGPLTRLGMDEAGTSNTSATSPCSCRPSATSPNGHSTSCCSTTKTAAAPSAAHGKGQATRSCTSRRKGTARPGSTSRRFDA